MFINTPSFHFSSQGLTWRQAPRPTPLLAQCRSHRLLPAPQTPQHVSSWGLCTCWPLRLVPDICPGLHPTARGGQSKDEASAPKGSRPHPNFLSSSLDLRPREIRNWQIPQVASVGARRPADSRSGSGRRLQLSPAGGGLNVPPRGPRKGAATAIVPRADQSLHRVLAAGATSQDVLKPPRHHSNRKSWVHWVRDGEFQVRPGNLNQIGLLEVKNQVPAIKNSLDGIKSRLSKGRKNW